MLAEIDRQRKEDEDRWLDEALSQLEVEGSSDSDDEEFDVEPYVEVSIRSQLRGREREEGGGDTVSALSENSTPVPSSSSTRFEDLQEEGSQSHIPSPPPEEEEAYPSFPLPSRSPPIPVCAPSNATLPHFDSTSSPPSTPLFLPTLTPDSSPPSFGPSDEMMGSSLESNDSELSSLRQDHHFLEPRMTLSLDDPTISTQVKSPPSHNRILEFDEEESAEEVPSLPAPTSSTFAFGRSTPPVSPPRNPSSPSSLTVALILHPRPLTPLTWTPPSPRSLSLPSEPTSRVRHPLLRPTSLQNGLAKSFLDTVDFGYQLGSRPIRRGASAPPPTMNASPSHELDLDLDLDSDVDTGDELDRGRQRETLALVLARPLARKRESSESRSRSVSPRAWGDRREWARFTQIYDEEQDQGEGATEEVQEEEEEA